jgi:hypothetical protein
VPARSADVAIKVMPSSLAPVQQAVGLVVRQQQGLDAPAEGGVPGTSLVEEGGPFGAARLLGGLQEQFLDGFRRNRHGGPQGRS